MTFPVIYTDSTGTVHTQFTSDGAMLRVPIRDITFTGSNFDSLEKDDPAPLPPGITLDPFQYVTNCTFQITIPIKMRIAQATATAALTIRLLLRSGIQARYDQCSLTIDGLNTYTLPDGGGEFTMEGILSQLQKLLPQNAAFQCCYYCAFSHYHPLGNDTFGGMNCYRYLKKEILGVSNKHELMELAHLHRQQIPNTQETWHCSEFTEATPDVWRYI
ncbi:hypothetical protein FHW36_103414 [Chitinophaga polysaccharea]|uniref:Uncharacterized protein n=1 Tax=Chitinophaga polysaccharea TaxID=1293035 RepID=A0A561PU29_9BACT|nr:DUF6304 family protein [Chitinophaga polysaccharea]TWF41610.1 hypothetical protein FHW36_103414 [Chitinophaga polysaccharea]